MVFLDQAHLVNFACIVLLREHSGESMSVREMEGKNSRRMEDFLAKTV